MELVNLGKLSYFNRINSFIGGCDVKAYPSISGTSKVVSVGGKWYELASGHNILYGSCSSIRKSSVGILLDTMVILIME